MLQAQIITYFFLKNINNIFDANSIAKMSNNYYTYNDYSKDLINHYIDRNTRNPLQREFGKYLINII